MNEEQIEHELAELHAQERSLEKLLSWCVRKSVS